MFVFNDCKNDARVLKEAATLKNAGWDIRIIASRWVDIEPYEVVDGVRIFRVSSASLHGWLRKVRLTQPMDAELSKPNTGRGEIQERVVFTGRKASFSKKALSKVFTRVRLVLRTVYRITYAAYVVYSCLSFRMVRKEPADVYHAHDLMTLPVAWLLKIITRGKLVYDCHELWLDRNRVPKRSNLNRFLVSRIESFLIRRTDVNIVVGESIAEVLSERYHIRKPVVILNAPDYHPVERSTILRDEIGIPTEDRIILYVGAITFNRGLETSVMSLKYLNNSSLVLMGSIEPNYIAGLKRLIQDKGLVKRVYFFGPVTYDEVTRYAASADIGIVVPPNACLSYYLCSPNKIFEYVSSGLPVVGSDFPNLKRVIEGHRLGVTVDPESIQDIATAVEYVLSDKDRYEEMRRNALEAAKIYNWQTESKKLIAIYENLAQPKE
jgi:glycosyltransferase involved in cell wall biosynthesis